ncbi:CDP-glycerol glycerophosphotransferase family protein [Stutzerimonas stutzeri]|uniref:CDP-glycerol glycerophosphotransferase family protein n=1 Tax=Stutzerimonas stutzeri TaxID=316 RepID=UPI001CFDC2C7|nr:CDP-glycerol glycerophosphotransferase family protein [Stutzerimonas stutzeri]
MKGLHNIGSLEEQTVRITLSDLFDSSFYRQHNPDVDIAVDPAEHFCRQGWRELRDPSPHFSLWWYWVRHLNAAPAGPNPLAHYLAQPASARPDLHRPGRSMTSADRAAFYTGSLALLEASAFDAWSLVRLTGALGRLGAWELAELTAGRAAELRPLDASVHALLGNVLARRKIWWRAVRSLEQAVELDSGHAGWFSLLGDAFRQLGRWEDAAGAYRMAIGLSPAEVTTRYRLGLVEAATGGDARAAMAFEGAVRCSQDSDVLRFGAAALHAKHGEWALAAAAFEAFAVQHDDSGAWYHRGNALEHCLRWSQALQAHERAVRSKGMPAHWHFHRGLVHERLEQPRQAADAYALACVAAEPVQPYWLYRYAFALAEAGERAEACAVWAGMAPEQGPLSGEKGADRHFLMARQHEAAGDWQGAARHYQAAADRFSDHRPEVYWCLGRMLQRLGDLPAACAAFADMRQLKRPGMVEDALVDERREYADYMATLPIRPRVILYESYAGQAPVCNPGAIFNYLVEHPHYRTWLHVWAVKDVASVEERLGAHPHVAVIAYGSSLYRRYLATAGFLVNNLWFPDYFIRREGQRYLNTWHGTPLKSLGKYVRGSFLAFKNTARNFLQASHLIFPNEHTRRTLLDSYDVSGLYAGQIAEPGYPRIDALITATPAGRAALRRRLGIEDDRPVVLYAPTWRGTVDQFQLDIDFTLDVIRQLAITDCNLVFRGHHFIEGRLADCQLPVTVATAEIDTCALLSVVDVLVTDYSSLFFDFLPSRRPILFFVPDLEEYQRVQGPLCFDPDSLPGRVCRHLSELKPVLQQLLLGKGAFSAERYEAAVEQFCPHEDGSATARAVAFLFENDDTHQVEREVRPTLLFHLGSFIPNGITSAGLGLVRALVRRGEQVAVTVDPWVLESYPARRACLQALPPEVAVLARAGFPVVSPEEQWVLSRFESRHEMEGPEYRKVLQEIFRREHRRLFGSACLTAVIDFSGYNLYWSALFALGTTARRIVYLHADMLEEQRTRFPGLAGQFRLYPYFDALVSVSEERRTAHCKALAAPFGIDPESFTCCPNVIDAESVLSLAKAPLERDIRDWLACRRYFTCVGRLSPEKDQEKLVRAFGLIANNWPDTCLVLVGDGPMKGRLESIIEDLGLGERVWLAGHRANPYPLLAQAACCVLSSNHEGHPMVLLEAMILQQPVIATDIEGCRAVLGSRYGVLAENSAAGLASAMADFLYHGRGSPDERFDAQARLEHALGCFDRLLGRSGCDA